MKRLLALVALLAGCSTLELPWERKPPPESAAVTVPPPADRPPAAAPAAASSAATLEHYKSAVAQSILDSSAAHTFSGALPKILKSVVVLQVAVDRDGLPREVRLLRSNGYKDLESRAILSVRAANLPRPDGSLVSAHGTVQFTETWLFAGDGRFQIRTLAGNQ